MATVSFIIPGAAVGKGRPRVAVCGGHARAYTPAKTRTREGVVASLCMDAMQGLPAFTGPVDVSIYVESPIPASWSKRRRAEACGHPYPVKPDLDNIIKLYLDAINGIAFVDDKQVVSIAASKAYGNEPHTTIQITEIDP